MMMSNAFKVTDNRANAEVYIVNMIVGSYFKNNSEISSVASVCRGDYYMLKQSEQCRAEAEVIRKMEALGKAALDKLSELKYEFITQMAAGNVFIWFRTGFEEIVCCIDNIGRLADFQFVENCTAQEFLTYVNA